MKRLLERLFGVRPASPSELAGPDPPEALKPREEREAEFRKDWERALKAGVIDNRALRKKHRLDV